VFPFSLRPTQIYILVRTAPNAHAARHAFVLINDDLGTFFMIHEHLANIENKKTLGSALNH
jgi:hypothetical protein